MHTIPLSELERHVGEELGASDWYQVTQSRIDTFADATDDHQWIHVDPEQAADGPYGGTIAHGYLTLSLLPRLTSDAYRVTGVRTRINYGLDRVRFPAPLRTGSRIRMRATLLGCEPTSDGIRIVVRNDVDTEGEGRPACVAETVTLLVPESDHSKRETR